MALLPLFYFSIDSRLQQMNVTHLARLVKSLDNCWFWKKKGKEKKMTWKVLGDIRNELPYPFKTWILRQVLGNGQNDHRIIEGTNYSVYTHWHKHTHTHSCSLSVMTYCNDVCIYLYTDTGYICIVYISLC